jgi:sec-independent protein translocase protein TatC
MPTTTLTRNVDHFDDDLFADSRMTFGEHLDELRICLFKAVTALAIGFVVGLLIGEAVVRAIETPLTAALSDYFLQSSWESFQKKLDERAAKGEAIPEALRDPENAKDLVFNQGLLFEEVFVMPEEVFGELKRQAPQTLAGVDVADLKKEADAKGKPNADAAPPKAAATASAAKTPQLMRIYLWRRASEDGRLRPTTLNAQEAFMIYVKAAFVAGAIFSSPFVFYYIWSFVAAGLYPHEKRYVHVFLPVSIGLFLAGAGLAFFFVFKPVLAWLFSFNRSLGIDPDPRISEWLSFVIMMPLAFGVSFQLPLVMLFLERIGAFTVEAYLSKWRIAVLVIAIASMVLSPGGDPYSMMMMFVPLTFLYFGGVLVCYYLPNPKRGPTLRTS